MNRALFRPGSWLRRPARRWRPSPLSLIPEGARAVDRRQTEFFRCSIRQLIRHGAWEQAWALIELSTEVHRYNPTYHRACEKARHRLVRLFSSAQSSMADAQTSRSSIPDLRRPFGLLSNRCEHALIQVNPQAITHWGCVTFPGISRGRFQGPRQRRFCNAVVDERYLFRGLSLADDPQALILRRRFQQGLSWEDSGGLALHAEYRRRTGDRQISWTSFQTHQLRSWDRLFARIQEHGYLSQAELQQHRKQPARFGLFNEVEVCVNAKGKVFFLEGKHRLVMAQILELPSIPVIVNAWSSAFLAQLTAPFTPVLAQQHLRAAPASPPPPPRTVPEPSGC
jgi:hypothetical protein